MTQPKVWSINQIKELECAGEIQQFKNHAKNEFKIDPDYELYVELEKHQICMLLYPIYGSFKLLKGDKQFTKLTLNTQTKIENIFKKVKVPETSIKHEFINRFRLYFNSVRIDQQLLEAQNSIWNRIAPRALVKQYENVYFGLTQFDEQWQSSSRQEMNKNVLVMPFQNKDKIILAFYQTKKLFSVAQINQIQKKTALFKQNQTKIDVPLKVEEKSESKLENQKEIMVNIKANNQEEKIPKLQQKITFQSICIVFIIILSTMVLYTYFYSSNEGIHVQDTSNSLIFKRGLFQHEKEQIDKLIDSNKLEFVHQLKQFAHYFTNPLHNTTVEINKNHPQISETVSNFIQESQPIQQKSLQEIVL